MRADCRRWCWRLFRETEAARAAYQKDPSQAKWDAIGLADAKYYAACDACKMAITKPPAIPVEPGPCPEPCPEPTEPEKGDAMEECDTSDMGSLLMSNRKLVYDQTVQHMDDLNKRALQFLDDAHQVGLKAMTDAQTVANRIANDGATASNRANADAQTLSYMIGMKGVDNTLTLANEFGALVGSNAATSQGRQSVNADAVQSQMASLISAIVPIVVAELKKAGTK